MKSNIQKIAVSSLLALVVFIGIGQLPIAHNSNISDLAALSIAGQKIPTMSAYGAGLAGLVDEAVKYVHRTRPGAVIKNKDMLASMCMELGDGYLNKYAKKGNYIRSYSGDYGPAQVKPSTARQYAKKCGMTYSFKRLKRDPVYGLKIGACIKDDLMRKCAKSGFTGHMMMVCTSVAYNGGPGKIDSIPRDGSRPRNCYGRGTPKSVKEGRMSCITVKYAYKTLDQCKRDIANGSGSRLNSSLWRSLIANTKKIESGGEIDKSGDGLLTKAGTVGDMVKDWWYTPAGQELADAGVVAYDSGYSTDEAQEILYYEPEETIMDIESIYEDGQPVTYVLVPISYVQQQSMTSNKINLLYKVISRRPFIPMTSATIINI